VNALELWVFVPIGVLAVIGAAGLVAARNPIHSALFLLLNLLSLAAIFLILWSPLMAALQIIVYAGAIMVLFIFVILFFVRPRQVHTMSPAIDVRAGCVTGSFCSGGCPFRALPGRTIQSGASCCGTGGGSYKYLLAFDSRSGAVQPLSLALRAYVGLAVGRDAGSGSDD